MKKHVLERAFGPDWQKQINQIRWESQHTVSERHKRTNTRPAGKQYKD